MVAGLLNFLSSKLRRFMASSLCHSLVPHTNVELLLCFVKSQRQRF